MTAEAAPPVASAHGLGWPDSGNPTAHAHADSSAAPGTGLGWPILADGLHPPVEEASR